MTQEDDTSPKVTRRAFVGLVSAGAVAALAGDVAAAPAKKAAKGGKAATKAQAALPADVRAGIEAQKKSLAQGLEKLRAHPLDTGVWPAFGFRPMKAGRPR